MNHHHDHPRHDDFADREPRGRRRGQRFGPDAAGEPNGRGPHGPRGGRGRRGGGRARRGDVRLTILALLAEQPQNGYQIIQTTAERTGQLWKPSPGAIYPALSQLADEGLIEQFDEAGQSLFRLTEAGRAEAAAIDPKPWEQVGAESGPGTLRRELDALHLAARGVLTSGSPEQVEAAAQQLAEARKKLYGLLAE